MNIIPDFQKKENPAYLAGLSFFIRRNLYFSTNGGFI